MKNKRSGSEKRQRNLFIGVRVCSQELRVIRRKAARENMTVPSWLRESAVNFNLFTWVSPVYHEKLKALGVRQKELFMAGQRPGDPEYSQCLRDIISLTEEIKNHLDKKQRWRERLIVEGLLRQPGE
ncbi:mobilization protein [Escherichia coli]|uniref:mobilization protein n=1 Tax=Escherichia coli TaxID=562 RepID=UPI003C2ED799